MAQLPPDGRVLIQLIGHEVVVFDRDTEREHVRWAAADLADASKAQKVIFESPFLTAEQKVFAHFWSGYFYAAANMEEGN